MSKEIVLEVRDDISEKYYFHMFSYYSLASDALVYAAAVNILRLFHTSVFIVKF